MDINQSVEGAVCRIQEDLLSEMEYNIQNHVFISV